MLLKAIAISIRNVFFLSPLKARKRHNYSYCESWKSNNNNERKKEKKQSADTKKEAKKE